MCIEFWKVTAIEFDGDGGYYMSVGSSSGKVCISVSNMKLVIVVFLVPIQIVY